MITGKTYFLEGKTITDQKLSLKNLGITENSDIKIKSD